MSFIDEIAVGLVDHKGINLNMPVSEQVDYRKFSRILDDNRVVASYKMYWLLGILDEVNLGNTEIEFKKLASRMIVYAWYPTLQYKLSYGMFDSIKHSISYVENKYKLPSNYDENKLLNIIYNTDDKELLKKLKGLCDKVPYRLLSPFFDSDLKGVKDNSKDKLITTLSMESKSCLYKIDKGEVDKIIINEGWKEYLVRNYNIIKSWIYLKLVAFLQKRNPNVPAIIFKLESPKSRDLKKSTQLWKKIISKENITDIYTGFDFNDENYSKYGVLSIDHFIPWSFVMHDEIWNLVPTFKNINSSKSDNLPNYDNYIDKFCDMQYKAFDYACNTEGSILESYMDALRIENPKELCDYNRKDIFDEKLRQTISPLYQIAYNQGFNVMDKIYKE